MIKNIFYILFFFFSVASSFAQPVNDNPCTAQNLGTLPAPAACPSGIGSSLYINGTTVGATPESPYPYELNCTGAGGINQSITVGDVWYKFTASGYLCTIIISSSFANPNVAVYAGTCTTLGGGVGGCAVGTSGTVTLTVSGMTIGTTYFIQVSGNVSQSGTFNMNISNSIICTNCVLSSSLVAIPQPVSGIYQSGQRVNFVFHVSNYAQVNTNWFHGVQLSFGAGWDLSSLTTNPPPPCQTTTTTPGYWAYYSSGITASNNGSLWPKGFYFETIAGQNLPGDNFGDNCAGPIPSTAWNFGFALTVSSTAGVGSDLSVIVNTSADGESGSWTNVGCYIDAPVIFNAKNDVQPTGIVTYNSFSPNGDGLNDVFEIDNIDWFANNHVYIYNRWGQLLWDKEKYDNTTVVWEGKDKEGNFLAPGTYFYIIEIDGMKAERHWVELTK